MSTTPRNLPRFLPTLTEVVHAPGVTSRSAPATPDSEEIGESVRQPVELVIDRHLREEVEAMVHSMVAEQLQVLRLRLHEELESIVRQAVSEAMTSVANQQKFKY